MKNPFGPWDVAFIFVCGVGAGVCGLAAIIENTSVTRYREKAVWYASTAEKQPDRFPVEQPQIASRRIDLTTNTDGWVKAGGIKPDGGSAPIRVDDDGRVICAPQQ